MKDTRTAIVNLKNYPETFGNGALRFARIVEKVADATETRIIIAPPLPSLSEVASAVRVPVYSQKIDYNAAGKSTGAVVPEALAAFHVRGSLINHSESKVHMSAVKGLMQIAKNAGLEVCVFAQTTEEVRRLVKFQPDYIAVEPREAIGTGYPLVQYRPHLIRESVQLANKEHFAGELLCGGSLSKVEHVKQVVQHGMNGIVFSSGFVYASDPYETLKGMVRALGV